jgi:hypothetical protein
MEAAFCYGCDLCCSRKPRLCSVQSVLDAPLGFDQLASRDRRAENTPNRKYEDGSLENGSGEGRKKRSKAIAESPTASSPGPRPPKRLLTIMASRKQEDDAFSGRATSKATPQAITATP